jgi:hypothetical protein
MLALRRAAATLWTGALWGGALIAWQFFATLDRTVAGQAVTSLFGTQAWIAAGCAAVLLLTGATRRTRMLVLGMLACALTIRLGLMPMMDALKARLAVETDLRTTFGLLHLGSSGFYAVECILGWMLVRE